MNQSNPRKVRILTTLLLAGVFIAGAVAGAGLLHWLGPWPRRPPHHRLPFPLGDLSMTRDQEKKAIEIMDRHRDELQSILKETFPKVREVQDTIDREIKEFLTPEQRKMLDELKARRPEPPPFGGPHGPFPGLPPGAPPGPPPPPPPPPDQ
jgi:Spy/CpxP family protein refolding chaperone